MHPTGCRLRLRKVEIRATGSARLVDDYREEAGFTLIELIIVMIILPIVIGGIASAMIAILQNEATTFNKVADSADAQITSANFARDIQSASMVTTGNPSTPGDCGWSDLGSPVSQPANSTELLSLTWGQAAPTQLDPTAITQDLSTTLKIPSGSPTLFTEADVGDSVTDYNSYIPHGTRIVAWISPTQVTMSAQATWTNSSLDQLSIYTLASVVSYWDVPVTTTTQSYDLVRRFCSQGNVLKLLSSEAVAHDLPANQGPAEVVCTSTCDLSKWVPTSLVSTVALSDDEALSGYEFNLSASPRHTNLPAVPSLLITGTNQALNLPSSTDTLTAKGNISFNSSGSLGGSTGSQLSAAGVTETQCGSTAGTSCPAVTQSFGGTLTCNANPCQATSTSSTIPLPLVLPPITPSGGGSCTPGSNPTCQPGSYPGSPLTLSGTINFANGNYAFSGPVVIASGSTVVFGTGQYTFASGLTVQPGSSVTGNGVFFYFPTSSLNVTSGPGQDTTVQLSPLLSGPYAGLLAFQPYTNASTMHLTSGGGVSNGYGGEIDATGASVVLGSAGDVFEVGAVAANSVTMGPSVNVTVGT